jgi:hypothetical protein
MIKFSCRTVVSSHTIYGLKNKMTPRIPNTHPETGLLLCLGRQFPYIKQYAGTSTPDFWPFAFFKAQGYLTGVQIIANACKFKKDVSRDASVPKPKSWRAQTFPKWSMSYNGIAVLRTSFSCQYLEMF